jgi:diaminopimelate decarboxylase
LNPRVGAGGIAMTSVAGARSRFGLPISDERGLLALIARYPFIRGVHVHVGSQGCSIAQLALGAKRALEFLRTANARARTPEGRMRIVDVGGGLPVSYSPGTPPPTFAALSAALRAAAPALFSDEIELVTEFGRSVFAESAWALTRVALVRSIGGTDAVFGHFGADFLLRPVYRPDEWRHEISALSRGFRVKRGARRAADVCGPLCFEGDVIARGRALPRVREGDFLVIHDVGAYTLGLWSHHCNRPLPAVYAYRAGRRGLVQALAGGDVQKIVDFWS